MQSMAYLYGAVWDSAETASAVSQASLIWHISSVSGITDMACQPYQQCLRHHWNGMSAISAVSQCRCFSISSVWDIPDALIYLTDLSLSLVLMKQHGSCLRHIWYDISDVCVTADVVSVMTVTPQIHVFLYINISVNLKLTLKLIKGYTPPTPYIWQLTLNEPGYGKTFVDRHPQNFDLGRQHRSYFPADPLHI
jgi:hypothetical protein